MGKNKICPNCGMQCTTSKCSLCGTTIPSKNKCNYPRLYYWYSKIIFCINRILFPPAKVMAIIWSFCIISILPALDTFFMYRVLIILSGYGFYCGIADAVYASKKMRYLKYQQKILTKQLHRLEKYYKLIGSSMQNNILSTTYSYGSIYIDNMSGHEFECFCVDLLSQNGFINVEQTPKSWDHGIDILASKDGITYAIQCKCYASNIGNSAVQQAYTGKNLYHRDVAVVLTNQYFTQQAKEEATVLGVKLWDRNKLFEFFANF